MLVGAVSAHDVMIHKEVHNALDKLQAKNTIELAYQSETLFTALTYGAFRHIDEFLRYHPTFKSAADRRWITPITLALTA